VTNSSRCACAGDLLALVQHRGQVAAVATPLPWLDAVSTQDRFYALGIGLGFVTSRQPTYSSATRRHCFYALGIGLGFVTLVRSTR
jgi:hypothetical protein